MTDLATVRGVLQVRAATASGFPSSTQIKYEGLSFAPTIGTPWARLTLMPNARRPFSVDGGSRMDGGLFQIDLYYPPEKGTATIEAALEAVMAAFQPGENLSGVWINYAERGQVTETAEEVSGFVRVSWRCHS